MSRATSPGVISMAERESAGNVYKIIQLYPINLSFLRLLVLDHPMECAIIQKYWGTDWGTAPVPQGNWRVKYGYSQTQPAQGSNGNPRQV